VNQGSNGGRHSSAPSLPFPLRFRAVMRGFFRTPPCPVPSPRANALILEFLPRRCHRRQLSRQIRRSDRARRMPDLGRQVWPSHAVSRSATAAQPGLSSGPNPSPSPLRHISAIASAWCGWSAASMRKAHPFPARKLDQPQPKTRPHACWIESLLRPAAEQSEESGKLEAMLDQLPPIRPPCSGCTILQGLSNSPGGRSHGGEPHPTAPG